MMKKVAFLVKDKEEDWEGLRSTLGLAVENNSVYLFVLDHEVEMTESYRENLDWVVDMEGEFYSNVTANVEKYGFKPISYEQLGQKLKEMDFIVPF
ncbi:MAG: hypothetical protein C0407_15315 [Desulfobacca sp.]|nr:hypothetical protein [Desulfobacca sp.]